MKKNKTKPIAVLLPGLLWVGLCQAQQSVNSSGGDASGGGGSMAYSIGQVDYTSTIGNEGTVALGVQQAYEIFTFGINETTSDVSVTIFPNPTADNLTLQLIGNMNEPFSYQLYDMQGKQLSNGKIVATQTQINMNSLPTASYLINVVNQKNKKVQSFKIIKN
jgi:hypothetical protein